MPEVDFKVYRTEMGYKRALKRYWNRVISHGATGYGDWFISIIL